MSDYAHSVSSLRLSGVARESLIRSSKDLGVDPAEFVRLTLGAADARDIVHVPSIDDVQMCRIQASCDEICTSSPSSSSSSSSMAIDVIVWLDEEVSGES